MNKQEALKALESMKVEQAKLEAIINGPESNRWIPEEWEEYWYVAPDGMVLEDINHDLSCDVISIEIGNCFRTKELAEASLKYKIMASEYDYWIPCMELPKPSFQPKGFEQWSSSGWVVNDVPVNQWQWNSYRWKRGEQ